MGTSNSRSRFASSWKDTDFASDFEETPMFSVTVPLGIPPVGRFGTRYVATGMLLPSSLDVGRDVGSRCKPERDCAHSDSPLRFRRAQRNEKSSGFSMCAPKKQRLARYPSRVPWQDPRL